MKFKQQKLSVLIVIAISLLCYCNISHAQLANENLPERGGLKVEPFVIHESFETEVQFDTNIYLSDNSEKFDIITILTPSIGLELPIHDHNVSLDYSAAINIFTLDMDESHVDQRIRALAEFNFTDFKVTLDDIYEHFSHRAGSEDTNRIRQQANDFRVGVSAEYDQLAFDVGYSFGLQDYFSNDIIFETMTYDDKDRMSHVIDAEVAYRFMPKTSFTIDGYLGFLDYDSPLSSDSYYIEGLLGLRGDLTSKITVNLKGGLRHQDYESSELTGSDDFTSFVARGGVDFYFTDDDIFNLQIERSIYESTYANMNYYNVNMVSTKYTHMFTDKISAAIFGSYQLNLYPDKSTEEGETAKRYDHLFKTGCMVKYNIRKWVSVGLKYECIQRDSRFSTFDFVDNVITIRGTVGF